MGSTGTGTLNVEDGGSVSNTFGFIGNASNAVGTVTVTGSNSTWTSSSWLDVGRDGTGTLAIANGGNVSHTSGYIGRFPDSDGTVTVTGADSTWTNTDSLYVGSRPTGAGGTGVLTVEDGGSVEVADTLHIWDDATVTLDGGQITTTDFTNRGTFDFHDGTLSVDGGVFQNSATPADLTLDGAVPGDNPELRIVNGAEMQNIANLIIGDSLQATLTIVDGGNVSSDGGLIGGGSSSDGSVTSALQGKWNTI